MTLKQHLVDLHARFGELESAARKLQNQNFADIVKSAKGKVWQLSEHPDVDAVHRIESGDTDESTSHGTDGSAVQDNGAQAVPGNENVVKGSTPFPS